MADGHLHPWLSTYPTTSAFGCIKPAGVGKAEEAGNVFAPSMFLKLYPKVLTPHLNIHLLNNFI